MKNNITRYIAIGAVAAITSSPAWSDSNTDMAVENHVTLEMQALRASVAKQKSRWWQKTDNGGNTVAFPSGSSIYRQAGTSFIKEARFRNKHVEAIDEWYVQHPALDQEREQLLDTQATYAALIEWTQGQ